MCGWVSSWWKIGPFLLTSSCCRCGIDASHQFVEHTSQMYGFTGIQMDQIHSRPPNSDDDLFWCKFVLGKWVGAYSWSNHWLIIVRCHIKFTFHHVTIWSRNGLLLLHRIREDNTSKWRFFKNFRSAHEALTYQGFSPFQFASNGK